MAFNFNWSPLIADTSRARDMLTNALNKSPKPPIIVDDIIVTELNLGSTPPSLEILEVGDLAEDRFRGIFKMVYSGDAFLTLKTRVQANPLNTYLSTKPSFASPQPLAAASGLKIPLAITLSDIRLSGFVILVFSRQKGITLVFRNDPLESLKVSSTFDSIPFVRDYLQNEIEKQLRILFMEDLPAIIHRLSLRLFVPPDHQQASAQLNSNTHLDNGQEAQEKPIDPLSSPPQGPTDATEDDLDQSWIALDDTSATYSFSRKNLLRLAALNDSHRTLSLFTPPVRDAVFRAWAGSLEHGRDVNAGPLLSTSRSSGLTLASLRSQTGAPTMTSAPGSLHSYSSDSHAPASVPGSSPSLPYSATSSRPTLATSYTTSNTYSTSGTLTSGASRPQRRKRKHRIVNLRKHTQPTPDPETQSRAETTSDRPSTPTSTAPASSWATESSREDDELVTPPDSPEKKKQPSPDKTPHASTYLRRREGSETVRPRPITALNTNLESLHLEPSPLQPRDLRPVPEPEKLPLAASDLLPPPESKNSAQPSLTRESIPFPFPNYAGSAQPGGILEQAWLMKMAAEIGRRAEDERRRQSEEFWNGSGPSGLGEGGGESGLSDGWAKRAEVRRSWGASSVSSPPPPYGS